MLRLTARVTTFRHYHHLQRLSSAIRSFRPSVRVSLNSVTEDDIKHFNSFLPESSIVSTLAPGKASEDDLVAFNQDWMDKYVGKSKCVLKPRSTEEVSKIMKHCYERRIAVVPQGGNTGLVGEFFENVILASKCRLYELGFNLL